MRALNFLFASLVVVAKTANTGFVIRDPKIESYMFNLTQSKGSLQDSGYKLDIA